MNKTFLRRALPVGAALLIGSGAGAAIYAGTTGSSGSSPSTVVASVPAQPAATTTTGLVQLYKNVSPGVVDITVQTNDGGGGFGDQSATAEGSGFVIDANGDIVTNQHVVAGSTGITVRFNDGSTAKGTLVGSDASTDLAVVKVNVDSSKLHPLTFGHSSTVQVGQQVAAIGSPFGLPESLTAGIVSALNRTITAPQPNNYSISGAIQTDAAINHGNSGGPLLNASGQVIGVNSQIESDGGGNEGVGFAIPSDTVKNVTDALIAGKTPQHAYLGVTVGDSTSGAGAAIESVKSGTPADSAGVKAGDVVTKIDGDAIENADDLTAKVSSYKPGDKATFTVETLGATKSVDVTFGQRPS